MRSWSHWAFCLISILFCTVTSDQSFDVVVYGATASGVTAAAAAAKEGFCVALVERGRHIGGMVSGGLGWTDVGDPSVIGGSALEVFKLIGKIYGKTEPVFHFEPHVAEAAFYELLQGTSVKIFFDREIKNVTMNGAHVESIITTDGSVYSASIFIDTSYEGDLLALAQVEYTFGRESTSQYNETYAGRLKEPSPWGGHQFNVEVDPHDSEGRLLPLIYDGDAGVPGQADKKVQAYNFRMCLTNNQSNRVPIPPPKNYDPKMWEIFRRYLAAKPSIKSIRQVMSVSPLPNQKSDVNNNGPISTDVIGWNWDYPEANWTDREVIWEAHIQYTKSFFYFLANDPAVPQEMREEMRTWGLAKDEFVDTYNWPNQLYVREARRMIGEYIMTQHDRIENNTKPDSIGVGSYNIDTHNAQRFPERTDSGSWRTLNDGDVERIFKQHFQIPYRCLLPKRQDCDNLIVPVCVSASHIGYGPIRLEPQYMIMGQSSGVAAAFAIRDNVSVHDVNINALQQRLADLGQILNL
eukprot:TRINITY_DN17437_c0_g1_i1.p1 TRINITY_DN17437_c0_g1~~TRINITY_DN17437_c0_g1_i1.p1  ORF type:complete len:522 (+),score=113.17 TRINITY_DN17437_c0_g1_i1:121-1686(+)